MSDVPAPDRARLERLRDDFHAAARDHSCVDAVVEYESDLRSRDTRRQVCENRLRQRDYAEPVGFQAPVRRTAAELTEHPECTRDDWGTARILDEWIPPEFKGLDQLGLTGYQAYHVLSSKDDGPGYPAGREGWKCLLFGRPSGGVGETAARVFENLASEAARLILRGSGKGKCPVSGWLIHLADRGEPLDSRSRKRFLNLVTLGEPSWSTVNPREPWCWWAARLFNVFRYSRDAVQRDIDAAGQSSTRVRCDESDRSVYLDGKRVVGEVELPVFRFFKVIAEAYPDPVPFAKIQSRTHGLLGKHPTRDLKDRLPAPLDRWVESGKHGYSLKLPQK
jgi:hypothetical protein